MMAILLIFTHWPLTFLTFFSVLVRKVIIVLCVIIEVIVGGDTEVY